MERFFAIVGGITFVYIFISVILRVWNFLLAYVIPGLGLRKNLRKYGPWAVVTGCTDGIGKAYAQQLAEQGLNIVLISRTQEKLNAVASELEAKYKVKTKVISADFTGGVEIYETIREQLKELEIGVLVNNVGMSYDFPNYFGDVSAERNYHLINCNILSCTMMTHMVLPVMEKREKGIIINIASAAGTHPVPFLSVYSGTKAYMRHLSEALDIEYKKKGIISQCVVPFFVSTKLSKMWKSSIFVPKPEDYVRQALGTLGLEHFSYGYWSHNLQAMFLGLLPEWFSTLMTAKLMLSARHRALRKLAKEKKQ